MVNFVSFMLAIGLHDMVPPSHGHIGTQSDQVLICASPRPDACRYVAA